MKSTEGFRTLDDQPVPSSYKSAGDVLYLHTLGKGRVVDFNCSTVTPDGLQQATNNRFVVRAVQWLAHRAVE